MELVFAVIRNINNEPKVAQLLNNKFLISEPGSYIEALLEQTGNLLNGKEAYTKEEFKDAFRKSFDSWSKEFKEKTKYLK